MKINPFLKRDIDRNLRFLKDRYGNEAFVLMDNQRADLIRSLAMFHSAALEMPVAASLELKKGKESSERRKLEKAKKDIRRAWNVANVDCNQLLTRDCIYRVNGIINREDYPGYRTESATLLLPTYTPPNPARIHDFMDNLFYRLKLSAEDKSVHPVELAAEAHFGIAAIQPFRDGNKRTARIYEGVILERKGYPTPIVPTGEREFYLELFEQEASRIAQMPCRAFPQDWHSNFADYVASKVNASIERILGREY